jgi:plastocyanin
LRLETLAVATVVLAVAACSRATTAQATKNAEVTKAPRPSNAEEVVIYNYKFDPPRLTVSVGKTVTWINRDVAPHTATYRSFGDEAFDSARSDTGDVHHTFDRGGARLSHIFHQGMMGTVVVQ